MKKPLTEVKETFYYRQKGENRTLELIYAKPHGDLVKIDPVYGGDGFENIPLARALDCLIPATERDVRRELGDMQRCLTSFQTLCDLCFAQNSTSQTSDYVEPQDCGVRVAIPDSASKSEMIFRPHKQGSGRR